jgi:hypothetical protein
VRRVVIAGFGLGLLLAVYGVRASHRHVDRAVLTQAIREIDVDSGTGDVDVRGSARTDIVVTHRYHFALGRPQIHRTVAGGVLRVSSRCSRFDFACTVSTRIDVPEGMRLRIRVKDGGIDVRRLNGGIDVDADAGGVSVTDAAGPVHVHAGTGLVTLERVRGPATVRTGRGDVSLERVDGMARVTTVEGDLKGRGLSGIGIDASIGTGIVSVAFARAPAHVEVRTRVGGVTVRVPSGVYAVRAVAADGRVRVRGITRARAGDRAIDVRAGAGDVAIRGATAGIAPARSPR